MSKRYTKESFISAIKEINPGIEVLSPFTKVVDRVDVRCIKCGLEWSPKAYSLLQGKGCPHCSAVKGANNKGRTARKTKQQFIEELRKITPTITVIGEYVNNKTKIAVRCNICKTEWSAVPNSLLFGHGCPRCAKSGTSFIEQFILRAFRYVLGDDAVLSRDKETIEGIRWKLYILKLRKFEKKKEIIDLLYLLALEYQKILEPVRGGN